MQITQTLESITITTDDCDLFLNLSNKIRQSFANAIGNRDKVIIFYNENELVQRKYFLKLIGKIYANSVGKGIDFLLTHHKNIKLVYKKPNSLQILINVDVKFENSRVVLDLKNSEDLFTKYLIRGLGDTRHEYFESKNILVISPKTTEDVELLDNILHFREHLKYIVNFNYDKKAYDEFKKRAKILTSKTYIRRFSMLANLLEEHFETLGCKATDDFETVRTNYLNLTKVYHPDKHAGKPNEVQKSYIDKFQKIGLAYEALKPYFKEQKSFISA
ncbi:adenylosuccinate lyase [Campylobacter fetus]|uniref:adenylosuccinate lyase n=1 Tax=Campylobacter fetus TaxID=196 RepID=UPI000FCA4153|nr:adenylosuccinate lyase [Campylobacter fetus]RUT51062.1 adenylosuccinate lyase [Campylobacter fetus]RUT51790.1 adenylosuccinate lyase [Campylobacter fetus]